MTPHGRATNGQSFKPATSNRGTAAQGEPVWNLPTEKGDALYLCLEDSFARVQNRLLFRLRGYCVEEVKRINRRISFDKAWEHQKRGWMIRCYRTTLPA